MSSAGLAGSLARQARHSELAVANRHLSLTEVALGGWWCGSYAA